MRNQNKQEQISAPSGDTLCGPPPSWQASQRWHQNRSNTSSYGPAVCYQLITTTTK